MYYLKYPLTGPRYIRILVKKLFNFKKRNDYIFSDKLYCFNNIKNYKFALTNFHDKGMHPMNKFIVFH